MNTFSRDAISARRFLLGNPYAFIEDLEGDDGLSSAVPPKTLPSSNRARRRHTAQAIEQAAHALHVDLWRRRHKLWPVPPEDPVELLDVEKALGLVGYKVETVSGLGYQVARKGQIEVAGLIDRDRRVVRVSGQFAGPTMAFTMAHELGHAVLHPEGGGIHRDRSRDFAGMSKEPDEIEADLFAVHFLMPARLLRERFAARFGAAPFVLAEDTAFALIKRNLDAAHERFPTRRALTRHFGQAETYNTRNFESLASLFGVSVSSMSIRLEELGLVAG